MGLHYAHRMIIAEAPATIANVGPGFDVLGFALAAPRVRVRLSRGDARGHRVRIESDIALPTVPTKNTAGAAVLAFMAHHGIDEDVVLHIEAGIPIGSGLGSSAASAVAAVIAANALFERGLSRQALLPFAVAGESVASGSAHADNVAPAMLGGMTLVRTHDPVEVIPLPAPKSLHYVVVHPNCVVETAAARAVLPEQIYLRDAVQQWAQVGALITALHQQDFALLGRALEDSLIEPIRSRFIPGYLLVKTAARAAGAIGCAIAGSGPSMFAFASDTSTAMRVGAAMQQAFAEVSLQSRVWFGAVPAAGAQVVSA